MITGPSLREIVEEAKRRGDSAPYSLLGDDFFEIQMPVDGVYTAAIPIGGCAWIETNEGIVVIDTLMSLRRAEEVYRKIHDKKQTVRFLIYSHGHVDHVLGAKAFLDDEPEIIGSVFLPRRLDKYRLLQRHIRRAAVEQWPELLLLGESWRNSTEYDDRFVYPTKTFFGHHRFKLGDKTFDLYTEQAETDDTVWVWIPELRAAFLGDLMFNYFPNIGNPWKPSRFAPGWAEALRRVKSKKPALIFYEGGGGAFHVGEQQCAEALDVYIEAIESLHEQVVECINEGTHISEMIHIIELPEHLKAHPMLQTYYSRVEFFVYNVYRYYHGYFDENPASLLPRPVKEFYAELQRLIGSPNRIIKRSLELLQNGRFHMALQILDVSLRCNPTNIEGRKLRAEILFNLVRDDYCLMSRNAYAYFQMMDERFLALNDETPTSIERRDTDK